METVRSSTPDLVQRNIEAIAALFPNVMSEALDDEGNLVRSVDFDQLRQELSDHVIEGPQERYRLDWPGKRVAMLAANAPSRLTLRPMLEESVNFETTKNIFIEGDNLEALKILQQSYLGKVDVIYIDPPYNTGNDFMYRDDFASSTSEYLAQSGQNSDVGERLVANPESNGRFHSDWLSMMYPRLSLARTLLSDSGVIIMSIDDSELANLRLLSDFVFGRANHIATVIWQGGRKNDSRYVSVGHDYLLIYARNESHLQESGVRWRERKVGVDEALAAGREAWEQSQYNADLATKLFRAWLATRDDLTPSVTRFKNIDDRGRVFNADKDLGWPGGGGHNFEVLHPITGKPVSNPSTGWRYTEASLQEQIDAGLVQFGPSESKIPRGKTFLDELDTQVVESVFTQVRTTAAQRLAKLLGPGAFDYPKDEFVLARWIELVTQGRSDAVILDFFAGSGSTGHAVMELNAADGGHRRFILVQINEAVDHAEYASIADVTRERLRRAGAHVRQESGILGDDLDVGFRSLRVASSSFADTLMPADGLLQGSLVDAVLSVKEDRSDEDLLFQVMLDGGLDLAESISVEEIHGARVLLAADGALICCFLENLANATIREIALRRPLRAVFLESAFKTDAERINLEQIFRELSPGTQVKVM